MRWKDRIIIALISGIVGYLLRGYLSLGSLEVPLIYGLWIALSFLVGLLGGSDIMGIIRDSYKDYKDKKKFIRFILSELELNQRQLKPLVACATFLSSINEVIDIKPFPNELNFYEIINFESLRDHTNIKIAIKYYTELKHIKEEYDDIGINGRSCSDLISCKLLKFDSSGVGTKYNPIDFLSRVKKAYDLGEELIINLTE